MATVVLMAKKWNHKNRLLKNSDFVKHTLKKWYVLFLNSSMFFFRLFDNNESMMPKKFLNFCT